MADDLGRQIADALGPSGRTPRRTYIVMTVFVALFLIASAFTERLREDNDSLTLLWVTLGALLYFLYWIQTVRRLRDSGDPMVLHWCFLWGGAVIPIWFGCKNESREDRWNDGQPQPDYR